MFRQGADYGAIGFPKTSARMDYSDYCLKGWCGPGHGWPWGWAKQETKNRFISETSWISYCGHLFKSLALLEFTFQIQKYKIKSWRSALISGTWEKFPHFPFGKCLIFTFHKLNFSDVNMPSSWGLPWCFGSRCCSRGWPPPWCSPSGRPCRSHRGSRSSN